MRKPAVFSMPSGVPFLPSLATGLREIYGPRLQESLILLPTRRAMRALGDAFVGDSGASLLPRMRPLADINPEEPPFEPGELAGLVKPAIDPMQRRFEIAQIIGRYHKNSSDLPLDPAGALTLADPLIAILDDAAMEEADISCITDLEEIKDFAAAHFQNAITLYKIIQDYWPNRLAELDLMEPMARRVALLNALTEIWEKDPPSYPVIVAGSTGTLGASARLMRCVSRLDEGMIILPGLNKALPETAWEVIDPQHPQNSLKQLIQTIGIDRSDVPDWKYLTVRHNLDARRRIISESLVPVQATGDWPARITEIRDGAAKGSQPFEEALEGLSIIEAVNDEEEALAIALILRESLEDKSKTAALVTPDPALARRVKARLRRWNVTVDYSQGEPLEETALGSFLATIMAWAESPESTVCLAALCKHPLTALGERPAALCKAWQIFEKDIRLPRGDKGLTDFSDFPKIETAFTPLRRLKTASAIDWAQALTQTAEIMAGTDDVEGAHRLWVDDAGEKAASLLEGLMAHGHGLPDMSAAEFTKLLGTLMRGRAVRPRYGTHPRLSILGPLEARMLSADTIILGGLNEGVWPSAPSAEPFLSRGMRQSLKLSLPERRFGLSAHDFAELAANPHVVLTRAARSDDGPRVASRWLWRLQTLLAGALEDDAKIALSKSNHYLKWARALDHVKAEDVRPAQPPAPTPPIEDRWPQDRKLSITQIKTWIRDPYSIYARHVLGLIALGDMDGSPGASDYGNAIHKGLENFMEAHRSHLPPRSEMALMTAFKTAMFEAGFRDFEITKDHTRLSKIATQLMAWIQERRAAGWNVRGIETWGDYKIENIDFLLYGKADLIEKGLQGYAVTDYKTGHPASVTEVQAGFDPQLPLTAFMLSQGAFDKQSAGPTAELNYVRIKGFGANDPVRELVNTGKTPISAEDYARGAFESLCKLITNFDKATTPYYCQPRAKYTHDYSDYNHLARKEEWARLRPDGGRDV